MLTSFACGTITATLRVAIMAQVSTGDPLLAGRDAAQRHAWREAFELLTAADQSGSLSADDLECLAEAAWWNGRRIACIGARERAFARHLEAGQPRRAALVGVALAKDYYTGRASAVGTAWLSRAERLLGTEPEGIEHGHLLRLRAVIALEGDGDFDRALALAQQTLEIGTRFHDRDLMALGLHDQGRVLVAKGQLSEGMGLLDEATAAAVSGELMPLTTGIIYCNLISLCEELADYRRAREWTEAASRWCERQAIAGFPGMCRVHRSDVMRLRGTWHEAEQEARRACEELREFNVSYAAEALYRVGEIRLARGDLVAAAEAFREAHELGRDPHPGLALLRLAEGKRDAASAAIHRALAAEARPLARIRLLPAQVEISLAMSDLPTAQTATRELESAAETYGTSAIRAQALEARGGVALAEGDSQGAVGSLCAALALWREVEAPYEEARVRLSLASAYQAGGDADGAILELQAARAGFARLGAASAERDAAERLREAGQPEPQPSPAGEQAVKTFLFTDMVQSTKLVDAIGDQAWNDLLQWHDQTLRALFARCGGEEIDHAGDGFFVAFEQPSAALECAIEIQRTLAGHRRTHGFAPQIRIGIHSAPGTRSGLGYRGKGIHQAARIAHAAEAGEILASWHTAESCRFPTSRPRSITLKGIAQPVQVVTVDWR